MRTLNLIDSRVGAIWFPLEAENSQMKSGLEQLIRCTTNLEVLSEKEAIQKVLIEYTELFLGPSRPKAPPWESVYRTQEQVLFGWPTYEVREALSHIGLEIRSKNKQPEDHIGLELMFLSAVSENLQEPVISKDASIIKEQISFIDKHLLSWIPVLCILSTMVL